MYKPKHTPARVRRATARAAGRTKLVTAPLPPEILARANQGHAQVMALISPDCGLPEPSEAEAIALGDMVVYLHTALESAMKEQAKGQLLGAFTRAVFNYGRRVERDDVGAPTTQNRPDGPTGL